MARKGKRKWRCDDCGAEAFYHWTEFERRERPRCLACGCQRLTIVSDDAWREEVCKQRVRTLGRSEHDISGFHVVKKHRKVT